MPAGSCGTRGRTVAPESIPRLTCVHLPTCPQQVGAIMVSRAALCPPGRLPQSPRGQPQLPRTISSVSSTMRRCPTDCPVRISCSIVIAAASGEIVGRCTGVSFVRPEPGADFRLALRARCAPSTVEGRLSLFCHHGVGPVPEAGRATALKTKRLANRASQARPAAIRVVLKNTGRR